MIKCLIIILAFILSLSSQSKKIPPNNTLKLPLKKHNLSNTQQNTNQISLTDQKTQFLSTESIEVGLTNHNNTVYTTQVSFGDQESFNLLIDTGSGVSWVKGDSMESTENNNRFNCSESSTCKKYKTEVILSYAKGNVTGRIVRDTLTIGDSSVPKYKFVQADSIENMKDFPFVDGFLGLGNTLNDKIPKMTVEALKDAGAIEIASFSLFLGDTITSEEEEVGHIVFGGYDQEVVDDYNLTFQYVNVTSEDHWAVDLYKIELGNTKLNLPHNVLVVPDSGVTFALATSDLYEVIIKGIEDNMGGQLKEKHGHKYYECKGNYQFPDFYLTLENGITLELKPPDYVKIIDDRCFIMISETETHGSYFILGQIFLRQFYLDFNLEDNTIGFSQRIDYYSEFDDPKTSLFTIIGSIVILVIGIIIALKCFFKRREQTKSFIEENKSLLKESLLTNEQSQHKLSMQEISLSNTNDDSKQL